MKTSTKAFFESELGLSLRQQLIDMVESDRYNTVAVYSAKSESSLSFVEKHMNYMGRFSDLNHLQYVSNLKLMTKKTV